MHNTYPDKYGRQMCPTCDTVLEMLGAWYYNLEIVPGRYSYQCPKCYTKYNGDVAETDAHMTGVKIAYLEDQVEAHLAWYNNVPCRCGHAPDEHGCKDIPNCCTVGARPVCHGTKECACKGYIREGV